MARSQNDQWEGVRPWPATPDPAVARTARARARDLRERLAARAVAGLFEAVRSDPDAAAHPGAASVLAGALAMCVHAVTAALAVAGILVVQHSPSRMLGVPAGGVLLAAAWLTRPRPAPMPRDVAWVESAPLHHLLAAVAAAAGARAPQRVGFDDQVNATYAVVGWRRRRVLVIGVPLWESLDPQARVALLAHEMGHAAARDDRHLLLVSTALEALREWCRVCRYEQPVRWEVADFALRQRTGSLVAVGELLARAVLAVVGLIPAGWRTLLLAATERSSQRAEYGADIVAADVAGREATVRALSTVMGRDALVLAMRRTAMGSDRDVLRAVRVAAGQLTGTDWAGVRSRRANGPFDSHPPDELRRRLVRSLPHRPCRVLLDGAGAAVIDSDLVEVRAWASRRVYDSFQAH